MTIARRWWLVWMLAWVPATSWAQDEDDSAYSFEEDDFVIVGEVQKPEVTVCISRENLNKSYQLILKESFLDKIIEAVNRPPF